MGDGSNAMWAEINDNPGETGWTVGEEEAGYFEDMNWEPTPIDAAPGPAHRLRKSADSRLSENYVGGYSVHVTKHI